MKRNYSAPTMKDVAREAGVSLGTVSKVINGISVGENYRIRVEEAAKKLGYQVNSYARSLKTQKSNCVALVLPSLRHPFFAILADELNACLSRRDYRSILMITNFDPEAEQRSFDLVRQNKADGVIALTYSPKLTADDSIPIVTIDRHLGASVPCVSSDNYSGGMMAAEKLLALGCRRLLFLRIGSDVLSEADRRGQGFEEACRLRGADYEMMKLRDSENETLFFSFLKEHMSDGKLAFDGIFCNTDGLACRVLEWLEENGIRVPEDVQVIGYDGIISYATGRYLCSTIVQPIDSMAETAAALLLGELPAHQTLCLPVRYAPGGTTKDSPLLPSTGA